MTMKHHIAFVKELCTKGGPDSSEYHEFTDWLKKVYKEVQDGTLSKDDLQLLRNEMGEALSILTLQGFVFNKPHGYPGDYEIIEKIYLEHTSNNPELRKWDLYFQLQKAPIAVRNRKKYFLDLLNSLDIINQTSTGKSVLNIASGPARDLFDFFSLKNDSSIFFDNVEFDPLAISYAKNLCKDYLKNIEFLHTNAFDFTANKKYRLIWSAGLFDYLNDKKFIFLLNRLIPLLENDGEMIIGNFSSDNPTQPYMEVIGDWRLIHRTPEQLVSLAKVCNFKDSDIRIGHEPEGVNLFLHLKCGKSFVLQN
jgi:extracellular factor (EF) 3-hydroxypalmitic acid methyl ester biosynthesis protein